MQRSKIQLINDDDNEVPLCSSPTCFLVDRAEVESETVKISDPLRLSGLRWVVFTE